MSSNRMLSRLAASSALAAGVLLTGLVFATPAYAADSVDVNLRAPDSATPGRPGGVSVSLQNDTDTEIFPIRTIFTIRMNGLAAGSVQMTQGGLPLQKSGGDGEIRFFTGLSVRLAPDGDRDDSSSANYSLRFSEGTPGGKAEIVAEAFKGDTRLGGESEGITIRGEGRGDPPETTPPNTDPGLIATFAAGPTWSIAPIDAESPLAGVDPSFPPILYVMGTVLLGVGGLLLWLLFRQRGTEALAGAAGEHPVVRTAGFPPLRPSAGPPRHALHQPTATLPTVRDPRSGGARHAPNLEPPSDPWAHTAHDRPIDRTREFDPFQDPRGPGANPRGPTPPGPTPPSRRS